MEKTRKFQIVYVACTNLCKQTNWPCERPYETGDSPAATLSHWGQVSSRKQSECGMYGLSNILELIPTFLYSIYHQRAGKTNLFHMRGGRFHAGNTLCTFNICSVYYDLSITDIPVMLPWYQHCHHGNQMFACLVTCIPTNEIPSFYVCGLLFMHLPNLQPPLVEIPRTKF